MNTKLMGMLGLLSMATVAMAEDKKAAAKVEEKKAEPAKAEEKKVEAATDAGTVTVDAGTPAKKAAPKK
jgi:hypothetical protein